MEMDSEIPISHPQRYMTHSTLTITTPTETSEKNAWIIFLVAIKRMMKAKTVAMVIPWKAEVKKALSDGIQAQYCPPVQIAEFIELGAEAL